MSAFVSNIQHLWLCYRLGTQYLKDCKNLDFDAVHNRRAKCAQDLLSELGIKYEIENEEKLNIGRPCIYVCNHTSMLDPLIPCCVVKHDMRFMVKAGVYHVPVLGKVLRLEKHIPVHRNTHDSKCIDNLKRTVSESIKEGACVFFFPEGTRTKTGEMGNFRLGAFFNAVQNDVPIVPMVIKGLYELMPKTTYQITPGTCHLRVLDPVAPPSEGATERDRATVLRDSVHSIMKDELARWK